MAESKTKKEFLLLFSFFIIYHEKHVTVCLFIISSERQA
jgi:hypothetical protein